VTTNVSGLEVRKLLHDVRQPLAVIQVAAANLRIRFADRLDEGDFAYLAAKLDRIEEQARRVATLSDRIAKIIPAEPHGTPASGVSAPNGPIR
jgi:nitrogen fixation/metabolism regulation signal transduction histidine kinase